MQTIFDWLTVAVFVVLAVLYLQRSAMPDPPDKIWHYLPPAIVLAVANYLGNHGYGILSVLLLVIAAFYIYHAILRKA